MQNLAERFGAHRVKSPKGALPQQADKLDASPPIRDSELLINVQSLNIDSASFRQIKETCNSDTAKMAALIESIVRERGKMQNPVTGSGGMLIGEVAAMGTDFLIGRSSDEGIAIGDRIATLVSLTLTPLKIDKIKKIHLDSDRVDIDGHAILFQSGIYSILPDDINDTLALAVLDVCGAPSQTAALCKEGQTVVVLGGAGKSGVLALYAAKKAVGTTGRVFALDYGAQAGALLSALSFVDDYRLVDARKSLDVLDACNSMTKGRMADAVINVTNVPDSEMGCILSTKRGGSVYFFSMATNFAKATLGAEGVGAHVELIMGNGYRPGHAKLTLDILRDSSEVRSLYQKRYGTS